MASKDSGAQLRAALSEIQRLRTENEALRRALGHAASPRTMAPEQPRNPHVRSESPVHQQSSAEAKVALFRSLFRGREDVYSVRWENRQGRGGYAPACANEWTPGICQKPRVKCCDCQNQAFLPLNDEVVTRHLSGGMVAGVYPLGKDDTCRFLAVDFDEADWRADARAFVDSCRSLGIPQALEISRSGKGAHIWIFFAAPIPASTARRLGSALVSYTCATTRQLQLASYDRLFPNQDTLPKGGFGNLIALPLQKESRERGATVFVDDAFDPYTDQWRFLYELGRVPVEEIESIISRLATDGNVLDVAFSGDETAEEPWRHRSTVPVPPPLPQSVSITLADKLYVEKAHLPQPLLNRLVRLAAFQNPEFYRAQAMRFPVWDKPRVIGCAENYLRHVALPRGCLENLLDLLAAHQIRADLRDERYSGRIVELEFQGELGSEQKAAVKATCSHDFGILCAHTGFGKTVTATAIIAARGVSTLILVHRAELLHQWHERLQTFLGLHPEEIGLIGAGKRTRTGIIDIAMLQAVNRRGEVNELVEDYGHVVVDECHHVSAFSFEAVLKRAKAKYVLGLTATPIRRDGHHPIITMQCGPIRFRVAKQENESVDLAVFARFRRSGFPANPDAIQTAFRLLAADAPRNQLLIADITEAYRQGHHILVMTERAEHVGVLANELRDVIESLFILHGRLPKRARIDTVKRLDALHDDVPRVVVATGRLIGEGFDHPRFDTMILAMPISWKGTLQQYAGRLQPLALEDLHPAEPGFQVRAVEAHLQPMTGQTRGHAVERALGAEHAELAYPRVELLEVNRAPLGQGLQAGALDFPGPGAARVEPPNGLGEELLVGRQVGELARAAQQQPLIEGALEAALTRLNGAVLVALARVVAAGAHSVVHAQFSVAPGQLFLLGQVVKRRRQAVGAVFFGHPAGHPQCLLQAKVSAWKLSPPSTTLAWRQPLWANVNWYSRWSNTRPAMLTPSSSATVKSDRPSRPGGCSWAKKISRSAPFSARH
jgi:superfamily II DNA or RNA helicase